jgi:cell division protein FtsI/penicillin-binding protein 2
VREALVHCANDTRWPAGSAAPALARSELGLEPLVLAAKTGSADLRSADPERGGRVLKHTWLASWFPAEAPRYVLVVFCYRTHATSSASSIWVAQQFLQHPTVKAWLQEQGLVR